MAAVDEYNSFEQCAVSSRFRIDPGMALNLYGFKAGPGDLES